MTAQDESCEVCGATDDVRWHDDCQSCGPAPLCPLHARDAADQCAEKCGEAA